MTHGTVLPSPTRVPAFLALWIGRLSQLRHRSTALVFAGLGVPDLEITLGYLLIFGLLKYLHRTLDVQPTLGVASHGITSKFLPEFLLDP